MDLAGINKAVSILKKEIKQWKIPVVGVIANESRDPFLVLISTILSLRTKDKTTFEASNRLFTLASTPEEMIKLSPAQIEKAIYPVGFYKTKAKSILHTCNDLINRFHSKVPGNLEDLLTLKGVGRKTANLVLTLGYDQYGICVDTHVHRISNRFGFIKTKTPDESEIVLRQKLPKRHWKIYNDLLVAFGQNLCKPVSPHCSHCKLLSLCKRAGVKSSR
ncbi:MAG: endonuclease III [Nitrospirae bacterium]|nr:endonuclease III [Nitrospirota bacterium]MBI3351864.1 endonuclease III [Nitrospirota bacterium]